VPSKTLVIIPTYNEIASLPKTLNKVLEASDLIDVLIVDDNSPDGTAEYATNQAANNSRVNVLHRPNKQGLGMAYLAGFQWGFDQKYEFMAEMDADGSHRAEDLPSLLEAARDADLVIGSRWVADGKVENWPFHRLLISKTANTYARIMLAANIKDITAGFRIYRSDFLRSLDLADVASAGYSFQVEMAYRARRARGRIVEVPITFVEREHGASKMSNKVVFESLKLVTLWGFKRIFLRR
jgi:dolichol-phosphate mannosyltransferase